MGSLRSALDEVTVCDVRGLSDDELAEHLIELERATRVLEAERARAIGEAEHRRAYAVEGFVSVTTWLANRTGIATSAAAQQVRLARALPHMPATRSALGQGEVSAAAAGLLVGAREADEEAFSRSEDALVGLARRLPLRDLGRAIEHWRQLADAEAAEETAARRFERRGLFVSATMDGMVGWTAISIPRPGRSC
jgi:uncharacterized protein DUF222